MTPQPRQVTKEGFQVRSVKIFQTKIVLDKLIYTIVDVYIYKCTL